jgi:hypothetical protein
MYVCLRRESGNKDQTDEYHGKWSRLVSLDGWVGASQSSIPVRGVAFVLYMANESTWSSPFQNIV